MVVFDRKHVAISPFRYILISLLAARGRSNVSCTPHVEVMTEISR